MALRTQGCSAAPRCSEDCASVFFERAAEVAPAARLYPMSRVLALAGEGRWQEADELLVSIYGEWEQDPRFPAISAILGLARGDLDEAEYWLASATTQLPVVHGHPAIRRLWAGDLSQALLRELKAAFPQDWPGYVETALSAEHRFHVLLWQESPEQARAYATRMIARFEEIGLPVSRWLERQGDALFRLGDYGAALHSYTASAATMSNPTSVYAKLSDVHFMLGDLDAERLYRERVYGSLRE